MSKTPLFFNTVNMVKILISEVIYTHDYRFRKSFTYFISTINVSIFDDGYYKSKAKR